MYGEDALPDDFDVRALFDRTLHLNYLSMMLN